MDRVRVYEAGMIAGWGPRVWQEMIGEMVAGRGLVYRLFLRDFSAKYKQSLLGVAWAILGPLIAVGAFLFLSKSGVLEIGPIDVPYPVYAFVGLTVWQVFAGGVTMCTNSIVAAGSMVTKINFPRETLVVSSMGQAMIELAVRGAFIALMLVWFQVTPAWTVVLVPLALVPLVLLTLAVGLMLSLLNAVMRDVGKMMAPMLMVLLFMTPVLYPAPPGSRLEMVSRFNPLAIFVEAPRSLAFSGTLPDPAGFAVATALSAAALLVAWRVFHLVEPRMAERV